MSSFFTLNTLSFCNKAMKVAKLRKYLLVVSAALVKST